MESLYILMPVALLFCIIAVACWFWAVSSGQYDDLDKESQRILFDEDKDLQPKPQPDKQSPQQKNENAQAEKPSANNPSVTGKDNS